MSRTTRVRILSQPLLATLTRAQAVMACDIASLHGAAATIAAGATLTNGQVATLNSVQDVLGAGAALRVTPTMSAPDRAMLAVSVAEMADAVAVQQRSLVASTVVNTLRAESWTVTVVEGDSPDRYTGIEATRGTEHLIAAVGPGELLADQAGAHDCGATVDTLAAGLREVGWDITVTDDVPHDGTGGTLYALPGGPTKAHAVQASLRHDAGMRGTAKRRAAPSAIRTTAG
jgi:hypothetical protein